MFLQCGFEAGTMVRDALMASALMLAVGVGCADTSRSLSGGPLEGRPIEVPEVPDASIEVAARVDQIGRQLISANPFLGVEPVFQTVGFTEPILYHPDFNVLVISEGLAKRCETDDALAAVLAAELGQMAAERKMANRNELPPLPVNLPDHSNQNAGGISSDQTYLAELANYDKKYRRPTSGMVGGRELAAEVLRSSGRSDAELASLASLIDTARSNQSKLGTFARPTAGPRWSP